jgi:membrane fusion protein
VTLPSSTHFFRTEALEAQKSQWLGSIVLMRPLSFAVVCWSALVITLALVALLVFGQYTKRARVMGVLAPERGVIKVMPPQVGLILARHVNEGDRVKAGDKLLTLSLDRVTGISSVNSAGANGSQSGLASNNSSVSGGGTNSQFASAAILESIKARKSNLALERSNQTALAAQQRQQLNASIRNGELELTQLRREIATQTARVKSVEGQLSKYQALAEQRFVSDMALQQKSDELLDQQSRLQGLERALSERNRALVTLRGEFDQLTLKNERERAAIDRVVLELDQATISTESQREIIITAPQAGTIATVQAEPGQIATGQPLLAILPEGAQLQAHLFAPSASVGFVTSGQIVRLRYAAYPYQKFGQHQGKVIAVTRVPFGAQELPANLGQTVMAAAQMGEGLYRITVAIDQQSILAYGNQQVLVAGLQLEALAFKAGCNDCEFNFRQQRAVQNQPKLYQQAKLWLG